MLTRGKAKKLTIFVSASDERNGRLVHEIVLERARACGIAGATVLRGVMGFGAQGKIHTPRFAGAHSQVPLEIEIIDSAEAIDRFLPELYTIVDESMVQVKDVEVLKAARRDGAHAAGEAHMKLEGKAKMLRIFIETVDQWEGEPLHEALVKRLRQLDIAGVTVIRGLMGYGANGRVHRHKVLRHDEPMVLVVVDTPEQIEKIMPAIDHMLGGGMAVLSDVDVAYYRPAQPSA